MPHLLLPIIEVWTYLLYFYCRFFALQRYWIPLVKYGITLNNHIDTVGSKPRGKYNRIITNAWANCTKSTASYKITTFFLQQISHFYSATDANVFLHDLTNTIQSFQLSIDKVNTIVKYELQTKTYFVKKI